MDYKFWIGDVIVPVVLFVLGCFVGSGVTKLKMKSKANANVKGAKNIVLQNSSVHDINKEKN